MLMFFLAFLNSSPANLFLMGTGAAAVPVQNFLSKLDDRSVSQGLEGADFNRTYTTVMAYVPPAFLDTFVV